MKRSLLQVLLLSAAYAVTTVAVGWIAVPALALIWGMVTPRTDRPAVVAMLGAGLGWFWLIGWNGVVGEAGELMRVAGGVMGLPGIAFGGLTVVFAMVVAWAATVVGGLVRPRRASRTGGSGDLLVEGVIAAAAPQRPLLRGEIDACGRHWAVREERRQGPRPQMFILNAIDAPENEMHIRPLPGEQVSTLDEVVPLSVEPATRIFFDEDGRRWEARIVIAYGESGEKQLIKLLTYEVGGEVYEGPYPFPDGLGVRTEGELRQLLVGLRAQESE
jgi:hypothetical protein